MDSTYCGIGSSKEPMWQLGLGSGPEPYPERPSQDDCLYYLRTGLCAYGARCRLNHPRDRTAKHASFVAISSGKIMDAMDFLVLKMGYDPSAILKAPFIVTLSLKKTIIPRCLVHQALLSKGLLKKNVRLSTLLSYPEKIFLERFVECFEKEAAELLKVYQEKRKGTK